MKDNFQANNQTIYFNMSHSHNAVLYGIYLNSEIGVDLEYIQQDLDWQEIANLVLTQKEKKKILLLPKKSAQIKEFYRIWTCKEAFLKARGTGLNISPSSIETNYLPNYCFHHSGFRKYMINFLNLNSSIHSFEILPNYMSAFVVSEEAKALKFFNTIY
ncbi:MAG: 4'-phosphopantetheinyl transferase superfamily protein [Holosporales bacterium]|nr:4'-phosphopantetheinyl transferase superfamily protein [Holosporales bacterium]